MSDVVVKIALIASIVLMGYNISEFSASFKTVSDKIGEFLNIAKENSASDSVLRLTNILSSCLLSIGYVVLVYFSDIVCWIVALVVVKLLLTLFVSDKFLIQVLRDGCLSKKGYLVLKFDALFNAVMGFAFAVILVL
ncbi:hypothetical protein [Fibrobacter sp. UWB11]|uniref:hypothetical protein n=1 Tax=Fibrobacter sp. UWB11 TaxID=1896202 RepID=UPI000925CBBD|nr:hypothetical protein [Fibrobacter sp. UWB11]SIN97543.1 hypothetical protein SAMN05720758_0840 [Fibrobacter sp. UWB11]